MSGRRGLVGQGYMPKGGRAAAAAHNRAVRAKASNADLAPLPDWLTEPSAPDATTDSRTDVRVSARSAAWPPVGRMRRLAESVGAAVVASAATSVLIEWVAR